MTNYEAATDYIYGSSNEIIKKIEKKWICSPNGDELSPCGLNHYYNFEPCSTPTAISIPDAKSEIHIFPNPAASSMSIDNLDLTSRGILHIYNELGQLIIQRAIEHDSHTITIPLSALNNGCYWIKISDVNTVITKKFIKQ